MELIDKTILVTKSELAELFGINYKTVDRWIEQGLIRPTMSKKYDLGLVIRWYRTYKEGDESAEITLSEIKRQHEKVKLALSQHELDQLSGKLIDKEEAITSWSRRLVEFLAGFWPRAIRLAPLLEMKTKQEIQKIIEDYDIELMTHFKREGSFIKNGNWTEQEKQEIVNYLDKLKKELKDAKD